MSKKERSVAYQQVSGLRTIESRLADGTRGILRVAGQYEGMTWLEKKSCLLESLAWEFECLCQLQETSLVPVVDLAVGGEGVFFIEQINHGATLREYAEATACGYVSPLLWEEIIEQTAIRLAMFWEMGWVHGDLHARNLVIGLGEDAYWDIRLIDLEFAVRPDGSAPPVEVSICSTPEDDWARLLEDLEFGMVLEPGLDILRQVL